MPETSSSSTTSLRDREPVTEDALSEFQRAFGEFGGVERRYAHVGHLQTRDNGDPDSLFSVSGQAIVFDRYSLDLGGFKEEIAPDAVREAINADDADYHLLWDHDTTLVLARNRNGTLKSEIAGEGVDFWGRVAKTSYAADLRVLMDRGDVDECSFAFTIADGGEEWRLEGDGSIVRRVTKIERLWDLTICARGAYPQTHSATVRSLVTDVARKRALHNQDVKIPATEGRALQPGLVAWDDEQGFCDIACDIECQLDEGEGSYSVYWWVIDINVRDGGQEAIVCRYEYGEGASYFLVTGITYDAVGEPVVPEASTWTGVTMKWVAVPTEVIAAEEGDSVVIVMDSASDAHQRIQKLIREADLRFAAELEARHAEAPAAELAEVPEDPAPESDEAPAVDAEAPAEDVPAADAEAVPADAEAEEVAETEETEEAEADAGAETDAEAEIADAEAEAEVAAEAVEESEEDAEARRRKIAVARARGRAASL